MTNSPVIEIVTLTIRDGISVDHFAALDKAVEREHVALQPGFVSRESATGENATWLVIVHWASTADAQASMATFADAAAAAPFLAAVEPDSMTMTRYSGSSGKRP